jgi:hypothetical protein
MRHNLSVLLITAAFIGFFGSFGTKTALVLVETVEKSK